MLRTTLYSMALLAVMVLSGCYPETPDSIDEYDLIYTNYAPSFDFKAEATYALPDSVVKVSGNLVDGDSPEMVSPVYGDQILNRIRNNMADYGWTEVEVGDAPDVLVLPSVITSTTVSVWYPNYYGWYYPWYGGWYYPGYYPPSVSSYTSGSLIIQMVDPNNPSATDNLPVVWLSIFNGLLEGSSSGLVARVGNSIDQAYDQSTYLKR